MGGQESVSESMHMRLRRWGLIGIGFVCTVLIYINMGSITAATPDLSGTFVVGALDVSWSGAACPLGMALALSFSAYHWSRIGLRRSLRFALCLLAAGAFLALISDHFLMMILARFIQGFGSGLALVYSGGLFAAALPRESLHIPAGFRMSMIGLASCSSPIVGCLLVQYASWRGIFVMTGLVSVILAYAVSRMAPNAKIPKSGKFDWFSFLTFGLGCLSILMVLIDGETDGWNSFYVAAWLYGAFAFFTLAVISCMTHPSPLLDLRLLGNFRFVFGLLASLCYIFCICWIRSGTVQFMRNTLSYDPAHIAMVFVALVLAFIVGAAIVLPLTLHGKIALRVGMMMGLLAIGTSGFFLSRLDTTCSWVDVAWPLAIFGVGYAFCMHLSTALAMRGVPAAKSAAAPRTLNTVRYLFVCMFISSVSTVLAHMQTGWRFNVAERMQEGSPGSVASLGMWHDRLIESGQLPVQAAAGVQSLLNKTVSLQSQIFSTDYFYLTIVVAAAAGVLFTLLCLRVKETSTP